MTPIIIFPQPWMTGMQPIGLRGQTELPKAPTAHCTTIRWGALTQCPITRNISALTAGSARNLKAAGSPHTFMGTMGELMLAIENDREPENSARDGLKTLQMLFAAYKSAAEKRAVSLDEITI